MYLLVKVCECKFETPDPEHSDYSFREIDLFPAVGPEDESYSIRKYFPKETYQIFDYESSQRWTNKPVWFENSSLEVVVGHAAALEESATGTSSVEYGHSLESIGCKKTWSELSEELEDVE